MAQQQHIPPIVIPSYFHNDHHPIKDTTFTNMYARGKNHSSASPYALTVRQQPEKARLCSFKDKVDRRPLDPPPIVQLHRSDGTNFNDYHISANFFLHATLAHADDQSDIHYVNGNRTTAGSVVQSLHKLKDTSNSEGAFFIFSDISVRVEGVFRLKFTLFQIKGLEVERTCCTFSEPFRVYSPKNFPGMSESTELTRSFSDQGVRIRIRKEARVTMTTTPSIVPAVIKRRRRASETEGKQQQRVVRQHLSYSPPSSNTPQRAFYPYPTSVNNSSTSAASFRGGEERATSDTTLTMSRVSTTTNNHPIMSMNNLLVSNSSLPSTTGLSPQVGRLNNMQTPHLPDARPSSSLSFVPIRHRSFSPPSLQQQQTFSTRLPDVLEPSISLTATKSHTYPFPLATTGFATEHPFRISNCKPIQLPALKNIPQGTKHPSQMPYQNMASSALTPAPIPFFPLPPTTSLLKVSNSNSSNISRMRREHTS